MDPSGSSGKPYSAAHTPARHTPANPADHSTNHLDELPLVAVVARQPREHLSVAVWHASEAWGDRRRVAL
jgi:hypothetical protein